MPKDDLLNNIEINESMKAFWVSLSRYIAEDPRWLLAMDKIRNGKNSDFNFMELYESLKDEKNRRDFSASIEKSATNYNWTNIQQTYKTWGRYGWITDITYAQIGYWDYCPTSQLDADKVALKVVTTHIINKSIDTIKKRTCNLATFEEAIECYKNKLYTACGFLLIALIDGELTRNESNTKYDNKKTGHNAEKRLYNDLSEDEFMGLPGLIHLELLNYHSAINTLFESANGFNNEPPRMNRNYLHHGMSKRKMLKKDCIKLILIYKQTFLMTNYLRSEKR